MDTYTTIGPVRGNCGHAHRSIRTAVACLAADSAGCRRQGGYSDRQVKHSDGTGLSETEYDEATGCTWGADR